MPDFSSLLSTLLVLLLLALRLPVAAQAPVWQSARAVAATAAVPYNYSEIRATAVDAAGNVFLAGNFTNSVVLGGITLTSLGGMDIFVAKFNPVTNQFVWAQRAGGSSNAGGAGSDYVTALAVSGSNVYVTGYFESRTVNFGPVTLTNIGGNVVSSDVFVAKLTDAGSTGSFIWAQQAGGVATDYATALAVNGTSVYATGFINSPTADFGSTTLTKSGASDVFVTKIVDTGSAGNFAWTQRAGGLGLDQGAALAVSGTSVYVAGNFNGPSAGFGAISLFNTTANGLTDVFVAKLTDTGSTGNFVWAQRAGDMGNEGINALAVNGSHVYVAGSFDGPTANWGGRVKTDSELR